MAFPDPDLFESPMSPTIEHRRHYCTLHVSEEYCHMMDRAELRELMRCHAEAAGYNIPSFIEPRVAGPHEGMYTFYFEWVEAVPNYPARDWREDLRRENLRWDPIHSQPSSSWDEGPGMTIDELLGKIDEVLK